MIRIVLEPERRRAVALDGDRPVGECTYEETGGVWTVDHTFVQGDYGGQGIARKLVDAVFAAARERDMAPAATCSYARKVLAEETKTPAAPAREPDEKQLKTLYLAGGCFWGTQHFLDQFRAVKETTVGYANGRTEHPSYQEVCHNDTGHAETVRVRFDAAAMSVQTLLGYYFMTIDPLSVNRQGGDVGTQYRTGIYYTDEALLPDIRAAVAKVEEQVGRPLAVEVAPLENFYPAEEYHQDYLVKNPTGYCHIPQHLMHLERP